MKVFCSTCLPAAFLLASFASGADTLKLRDGRSLTGQFVGATRSEVWFQADNQGEFSGVMAIPVAQVASVAFEPALLKPSGLGAIHPTERPAMNASRFMASVHASIQASVRAWIAALPLSNSHSQYFALARSQK
jgi:hypothetical protein